MVRPDLFLFGYVVISVAEEDKALDAEDAKKREKFDKIMNWLTIGAFVVTAIILIIRFIG